MREERWRGKVWMSSETAERDLLYSGGRSVRGQKKGDSRTVAPETPEARRRSESRGSPLRREGALAGERELTLASLPAGLSLQ